MTNQTETRHAKLSRRSLTTMGFGMVAGTTLVGSQSATARGTADERYARGVEVLKKIGGAGYDIPVNNLAKIAPDLARFTVEYPYGDILSRPGLELKLRQVVTVSALMADGSVQPQLRYHMNGFLNAGGTPQELVELIFSSIATIGFTSPINAIVIVRDIFKERNIAFQPLTAASDDGSARYERGLKVLAKLNRGDVAATLKTIEKTSPEFARWLVEFAYGDILSREGLDPRMRQLSIIAMLAAKGNRVDSLKFNIEGGLNVGLKREEIIEALTQLSVYSGFPSALNAFTVANTLFTEIDKRGAVGAVLPPVQASETRQARLDRGLKSLAKTSAAAGQAVVASFNDIAPDIGKFIVEHAYGDVFQRPGLDLKSRELSACSALAAIGSKTMETPLRVHVNAAITAGATKTEIVETLLNLIPYLGYPVVEQALRTASEEMTKRGL